MNIEKEINRNLKYNNTKKWNLSENQDQSMSNNIKL